MELSQKAAWLVLALIHIGPALAGFRPKLLKTLYGVEPGGLIGTLLAHRGVLFLAVVMAALYAAFTPSVRPLSSLILSISMIGFLIHYIQLPSTVPGLRKIALIDAMGMLPLAWVSWASWTA